VASAEEGSRQRVGNRMRTATIFVFLLLCRGGIPATGWKRDLEKPNIFIADLCRGGIPATGWKPRLSASLGLYFSLQRRDPGNGLETDLYSDPSAVFCSLQRRDPGNGLETLRPSGSPSRCPGLCRGGIPATGWKLFCDWNLQAFLYPLSAEEGSRQRVGNLMFGQPPR